MDAPNALRRVGRDTGTPGARREPARGAEAGRVTAILGPTNTGKTHFAMERLLAHASGMIGFPLRLLARENYDRAVRIKGEHAVALVTGEEKILPPGAAYFVCTVEAMPVDRQVAFVAVDEVQLVADPERGHVFTDRLLRLRGAEETVFIGAETIRPVLRALVPEAEIVNRPRFSRLTYSGPKKITRLPARTAVIGFSASEVYGLAEVMRRRRGGTAVVLGALSPRTRNAQVELYQSGDVDYLVATDAIGMGLNMDIDHVAFSALAKFDGRMTRGLTPAEIGQIAGRAGRHRRDGTFGTTAGADPLNADVVEAVEEHSFAPIKFAYWRNADLDFSSPDALVSSLVAPPGRRELAPAREAEDFRTLTALAAQPGIRDAASGPRDVALLWEVCQIPDFRKILGEAHVRLTGRIYADLVAHGRIGHDWMARHVERIDRTGGDIGTLVGRIAEIRTWTYVSHRSDWLDDPLHWQERTRAIEDRLSDALHERLTERFVDRRSAVLLRRLRGTGDLVGGVTGTGEVVVEGLPVGRLEGFGFVADAAARGEEARALHAAAGRALRGVLNERLAAFDAAPDRDLRIEDDGRILWHEAPVAELGRGSHPLSPTIRPLVADFVEPDIRDAIAARVDRWLAVRLGEAAGILVAQGEGSRGAARGILYRLAEALGALPRSDLAEAITGLDAAGRRTLHEAGVRLGRQTVFLPRLLRPEAQRMRAILWRVWTGRRDGLDGWRFGGRSGRGRGRAPAAIPAGTAAAGFCLAVGYRRIGRLAIRADRLEELDREASRLAAHGRFAATPALAGVAGCRPDALRSLLEAIGFVWHADEAGGAFERRKRSAGNRKARGRTGARAGVNPCSPFAVLHELTGRR